MYDAYVINIIITNYFVFVQSVQQCSKLNAATQR